MPEEANMALLERRILDVAREEGFGVEELKAPFNQNFQPLDPSRPDRCADGRKVLEEIGGEVTGFKNDNYNGPQIPGATLGALDVIKKVAKISEEEARMAVSRAYMVDGFQMGAHIDDHHGHIKTKAKLDEQFEGCGNQFKKAEGQFPMYPRGSVNTDLIKGRQDWLKKRNAPVIPLAEAHTEKLAAINLKPSTTYDNLKGLQKSESIFNCDLLEVARRANSVFEVLQNTKLIHTSENPESFEQKVVKETVRDYFQTLVALNGKKKIYINK